ncbi:6420_t:CDS:2 [Ambispora leptoticha]|uniref:6420_t:CDS:1 n=1 Tax=Ambispora leptoticha TaxID=144679 RepID=A0A9N8VR72_9GLOM|nr:6420_t:CDS:2 [Ambispora leptoticha]
MELPKSRIVHLVDSREILPQPQKWFTTALKGDPYFVRRFNNDYRSLTGHTGCVNTVIWNKAGDRILSGSDDNRINIWAPFEPTKNALIHTIPSGHKANIFSAHYMTNTGDRHIVSCAADGIVKFTDLGQYISQSETSSWNPWPSFQCHSDLTYQVLPDPIDSNIFFDCSDDGTINLYDLRIRTSCNCDHCTRHTFLDLNMKRRPQKRKLFTTSASKHEDARSQSEPESEQQSRRRRHLFESRSSNSISITNIAIRPDNPVYLAAACSDDTVRVYDRRFIPPPSSDSVYHRDAQVYTFIPTRMKHDSTQRKEENHHFDAYNYHRMTCLIYDPNGGGDLLASYSRDKIYLIRPGAGKIKRSGKSRMGGIKVPKKEKNLVDKSIDNDDDLVDEARIMESANERVTNDAENIIGEEMDISSDNNNQNVDTKGKNKESDGNIEGSGSKANYTAAAPETEDNIPTSRPLHINSNDIQQNLYETEDIDYEDDNMHSSSDEDDTDFNIEEANDEDIVQTFSGHLNEKTMIKEANFFGDRSQYVMSGSDDRRIFVWDKKTGRVINLLIGDRKVVNCIQPHPYLPILCTSGIDNDVKIWQPCADEEYDVSKAEEIVERNNRFNETHIGAEMRNRVMIIPSNMIWQMLAMINEGSTGFFDSDNE